MCLAPLLKQLAILSHDYGSQVLLVEEVGMQGENHQPQTEAQNGPYHTLSFIIFIMLLNDPVSGCIYSIQKIFQ